jgi:hypothetical protein
MEETKDTNGTPGTQISAEQAAEVGGGVATVTVGGSCTGVSNTAPTPGEAMIGIYDGAVEVTSHIIETVVHAAK